MGMYTRLTFWAELPENSPAVPVIRRMHEHSWTEEGWPDHPFFRKAHAWGVLNCSSYYHQTGRTVFTHDKSARCWFLNIDSSLKNYAGEIKSFLDWLSPYDADISGSMAFRGFFQYEEDEHPTLIYRLDGVYRLKDINAHQGTLEKFEQAAVAAEAEGD